MKKKLLVSFSGGKTSGYMLWWLFNEWQERDEWDKIVVFANTGKEAEGTLFFVDECSQEWNIPIWWVQAVPRQSASGGWWGVDHMIVDYDTASRKGEPFEEMIKRLGVPSTNAPFCSDQLKRKAIESLLNSIGWKDYWKAIGIRADEKGRVRENYEEAKIIYPLAHLNPVSKKDVTNWWKAQSFNLDIHPDEGNCDNCWKKDNKRLNRNASRNPKSFEWWQKMTDRYGHLNPRGTDLLPPFNFYRGNRSPKDIILDSKEADRQIKLFDDDVFSSCNESCEAF